MPTNFGLDDDEKKLIQNRLKSKVVWLSVIAQIVILVGLFAPGISDQVKIVLTSICEIASLFGILNDPTNKGGF